MKNQIGLTMDKIINKFLDIYLGNEIEYRLSPISYDNTLVYFLKSKKNGHKLFICCLSKNNMNVDLQCHCDLEELVSDFFNINKIDSNKFAIDWFNDRFNMDGVRQLLSLAKIGFPRF